MGPRACGGAPPASLHALDLQLARADLQLGLTVANITTFLPVSTGILALGGRVTDAAAWTSAEGVSWSPVEDDVLEDAYLTSGATAGGIVVAVGATQRRIPGTESFVGFATAWRGAKRSR